MKPKMKYSTTKISSAKMKSTAGKALCVLLGYKVLLRYYESQFPLSETDGDGSHRKLMVNLSPTKDKDFLLHANSKEHSVELQKCENQLPEQAFFVLHETSSQCVSFECKSNPGVFLGVKDNQLALIKRGEDPEDSNTQNITFKLSNLM
ncbi:interleukin-33 isoform X3 [Capricornis sumatraensis]|uniref:interleukin-33 isoform X3 n=1 Tax=Capricornis sumatraensis TaxID=34865 RepID=UPI00360545CF